nr:T-cell receptor alpha [Danio rerio]
MAFWKSGILIIIIYIKGCDSQEKVDQHTKTQSAFEGDTVTIDCTFQTSYTGPTLFWYQQKINGVPRYMLNKITNTSGHTEDELKERFHAALSKTSVPLTIKDVRVSDSAVYYCALNNNIKIVFGRGTKLTVQSKTEVKPNIYQVGNSCLATDFTKHNVFNISGSPFLETSAVRYSGQSYYSSFKFGSDYCEETGVCLLSGGGTDLEKDEKVNFLSLGIFWLRILFLKKVVFNVLVTFKAWMS